MATRRRPRPASAGKILIAYGVDRTLLYVATAVMRGRAFGLRILVAGDRPPACGRGAVEGVRRAGARDTTSSQSPSCSRSHGNRAHSPNAPLTCFAAGKPTAGPKVSEWTV